MNMLQWACWGDLLLKQLVNHSDHLSGFTVRLTKLYRCFFPKTPLQWAPQTNFSSPEEIQMQIFTAEILVNYGYSLLLKAFPFGYPSLKNRPFASQWALLQFLSISANLLAASASNIESCPEGLPSTAWDGGGRRWDRIDHQHLGITLVMCLGLRVSGGQSNKDFFPCY